MLASLLTLLLAVGAVELTTAQQLYEGSKCATGVAASPQGVCSKLADCPWAEEEVRKNRRPKICRFSGPWPIVCCPGKGSSRPPVLPDHSASNQTSSRSAIGLVARKKCEEYAQYVFAEEVSLVLMLSTERVDRCAADADPLIVGGAQAKAREFPHMALVGYGEEGAIDWLCGGSLISEQFVLTAGHCLITPADRRPARWVLLGELDRSTDEDEARPQTVAVAERIKHPEYKPPATYNDIALLRLESRPDINGYARPACLHTEPALRTRAGADEVPLASGWGNTDWGGDSSNHLMKVALRVSPHPTCSKAYESTSRLKLPRGILDESQVCAGGFGKDTCQGDSGGPLQVSTKNYSSTSTEPYCMYKIVGVTSFGQACGFNAPGVYTRVYHYVPWIESIVWPRG